jgi:hypothetical protein
MILYGVLKSSSSDKIHQAQIWHREHGNCLDAINVDSWLECTFCGRLR